MGIVELKCILCRCIYIYRHIYIYIHILDHVGADVQKRVPVGFPLTRGHAVIGVHESRMMLRIAYIPQMMGRILHDFMCSYQHSKNWWIIWSCVVLCIDAGTTLHRRFSNQSLYVILIIFISEALNSKTPGFPAPSFFNGRPLLHQLLYALNLELIASRPSQSPRFRVGVWVTLVKNAWTNSCWFRKALGVSINGPIW